MTKMHYVHEWNFQKKRSASVVNSNNVFTHVSSTKRIWESKNCSRVVSVLRCLMCPLLF